MMHLSSLAAFFFAVHGILAQSPSSEPPESGSPTTGTPDVTFPSSTSVVFCSAPDCAGTCEVVETADYRKGTTEGAPNDMGFQSIYLYDPGDYDVYLYACLNDCLVINPVEITEAETCYNLYNNSVSTDFYTWYYMFDTTKR